MAKQKIFDGSKVDAVKGIPVMDCHGVAVRSKKGGGRRRAAGEKTNC